MSDNQFNSGSYNKTEKDSNPPPAAPPEFRARPSQSHLWIGALLLLVGLGFLMKRIGFFLPDWLLSWQMVLIGIGVFLGIRKDFQGATWLILILIGGLFLINEFVVFGELRRYLFPLILIGAGLFFIFRPRKTYRYLQYDENGKPVETPLPNGQIPATEDFVDATSIFGGSKKKVFSKAFRGGDIVNIFGGSEINLSQADFSGTAIIEVTVLFGGATLLVPSNWNVVSNAVSIFGDVKDKRVMTNVSENYNKTLLIKGSVLFGGVDIKSF